MRRTAMLLMIGLPVLTGCGVRDIRQESFADRCADMLRQSYPGGGDIEITDGRSGADPGGTSLAQMTASVQGRRKDLPETGFVARDVAAECHFDRAVLTEFHWTLGPFR